MSLMRLRFAHKGGISAGGGGGSGSTTLLLGLNVTGVSYDSLNRIESDYRFGSAPQSLPSGAEIVAAKRDALGWPTGPNSGDTKVRYNFRNPEAAGKQIVVSYTPGTGSTVSVFNCTVVTAANDAAGTITVAPADVQPTASGWGLDFTPGTSCPKLISAKEVGDASTYAASYLTHISQLATSSAPVRTMKATSVEANDEVVVSNTSQALPSPVILAANRVKTTSGDHSYNFSSGYRTDVRAMEEDINAAIATSGATWRSLPWNAEDAYYDAIADVAAAAALNNGVTTYFEVSNEIWNGGYKVFSQARYEGIKKAFLGAGYPPFDGAPSSNVIVVNGTISGTTLTINSTTFGSTANIVPGMPVCGDPPMNFSATIQSGSGTTWTLSASPGNVTGVPIAINCGLQLERAVDKVIDVMDRIKARYVAAGAPLAKLKRVFAWQNATMSTYFAGKVLDYAPPGKTALKNHIDVLSSAGYLNADYVAGGSIIVPNTSTTASDFTNAMLVDIDEQIDQHLKQAAAEATARGLSYVCYEWGPSVYVHDTATNDAVQNGSAMYDLMMHAFSRQEAAAPGSGLCNFALPHVDYFASSVGPGGSWETWGILRASNEAIGNTVGFTGTTRPKYCAQRDYLVGKRRLQPLLRTSSAPTVVSGSAAGTTVATYNRTTVGSTITVNDGKLTAVKRSGTSLVDIKVAIGATFPTNGTYSFNITESHSSDINLDGTTRGSLVTSDSYTVSGNAAGIHWDAANSNAGYTFDGSLLAATRATGAGDAIVRCATGHTSGSYDMTVTVVGTSDYIIGFTSNPTGSVSTWAGDTGNVGLQSGGNIYYDTASHGTTGVTINTLGDKVRVAYSGTTVTWSKWNGSSWAVMGTATYGAGAALYPIISTGGTGWTFTADFTNWP